MVTAATKGLLSKVVFSGLDVAIVLDCAAVAALLGLVFKVVRTKWIAWSDEQWKPIQESMNKFFLMAELNIRYDDLPRGHELRIKIKDNDFQNIAMKYKSDGSIYSALNRLSLVTNEAA
jgi:hypothetical protein